MAATDKQIKAALKEGGKKGQDLEGMGVAGIHHFTVVVYEAAGDWTLMDKILEGMNAEVDPAAEDRKGGAGKLAKLLLYADEKKLMIAQHWPPAADGEGEERKVDPKDWISKVLEACPGAVLCEEGAKMDGVVKYELLADSTKEIFPLKIRDTAASYSYQFLVANGLIPEDDDDDDYVNYAEDAGVEW